MGYDKNYNPEKEEENFIKKDSTNVNNNDEVKINNIVRSEIENEIKLNMNNVRDTKVKKTMDLTSNIHGSEFYSKNFNSKNKSIYKHLC